MAVVPIEIYGRECRITPGVATDDLSGVEVGAREDSYAGVGDGGLSYVEKAFGCVVVYFWGC